MKLLMENWRKFLNERMKFGEGFEQWIHGEGECEEQSVNPSCLMEYGFEKVDEGSFREVWQLPDNPNYVMKVTAGEFGSSEEQRVMNQREADMITQTGYPDLLPKVYDRAKDYSWIVVEAVEPYEYDDKWIDDYFPIFKKFQDDNRKNKNFAWRGDDAEDFFQGYTERRIDEIRKKINLADSKLTVEFGGARARKEFEDQLPPLYHRVLELIEHHDLTPSEVRSDNVGRGIDGRFVILDIGGEVKKKK